VSWFRLAGGGGFGGGEGGIRGFFASLRMTRFGGFGGWWNFADGGLRLDGEDAGEEIFGRHGGGVGGCAGGIRGFFASLRMTRCNGGGFGGDFGDGGEVAEVVVVG
jgi:hypothetical protein